MTLRDIAHYRLVRQQIASPRVREPGEVVATLGAMQAQDYLGALWAIGLRLVDASETLVEQAIAERKIIRTWPMRGTLHFVAAADVRWMLKLLAPRIIAGSARRCRELELDDAVFARSRRLFVRALQKGRRLTRSAMMEKLEKAGISTVGSRGNHILSRLALEGLVCFAGRSGKQQTLALLEEWVPQARRVERDAALAELTRRYFTGHGPATLQDFVWWSGLKISDARAGLESVAAELSRQIIDGAVYWMDRDLEPAPVASKSCYLLPPFDEYLVSYRDRSAVLEPHHAGAIVPGSNGMFLPTIVMGGHVVGTWKRTFKNTKVVITASPFTAPKKREKNAFAAAAERYGRFVGLPVETA